MMTMLKPIQKLSTNEKSTIGEITIQLFYQVRLLTG